MVSVSDNGAFVLHLMRCLGRTKYLWGSSHSLAAINSMIPPPTADCSGFISWGYNKIGVLADGKVLDNFIGTAATFQSKCHDLGQELSVLDAANYRGAHLFLLRPQIHHGNHIATVIAPGWMIHCTSTKGGVWVERIADRNIHWTHAGYILPIT